MRLQCSSILFISVVTILFKHGLDFGFRPRLNLRGIFDDDDDILFHHRNQQEKIKRGRREEKERNIYRIIEKYDTKIPEGTV